jgi:hypothetical protein
VAMTKISAWVTKPPRPLTQLCHICGVIGHKLTTCPKFNEM